MFLKIMHQLLMILLKLAIKLSTIIEIWTILKLLFFFYDRAICAIIDIKKIVGVKYIGLSIY